MKKRLFAFLLAVVMVLGVAAPAFADTKTTTTETTTQLEDGTTVTTTITVTVTTPEDNPIVAEAPAAEPAAEPEAPAAPEEPAEEPAEPDGDAAAQPAASGEIVLLYTNDVHCGISSNIGYRGLALLKNALKNAGKNVLLVDNGDAVQGDTVGTLSRGEYIIDLMNAVGYDVATIGNHEFDYGMDQFHKNVSLAKFPFVCANFTDLEGNPILDPYTILEIGGKKIAFVGIVTPRTFITSTPTYFQNADGEYIFSFSEDPTGEKLYAVVQAAVDAARAEGADYVIALSHLGIEQDCSPWTSSEVITRTSGIDAFLDGHSHSKIEAEYVLNKDGKQVLLSSTETKLAYVGCLVIGEDGSLSSMLLDSNAVAFGTLANLLTDDGGVGEKIAEIDAEFDALVNSVVAHTDVDLVTQDPKDPSIRIVRSQETNLGDLCADAYRLVSGADIAFVNGGGVRKSIAAGDITYGDIISVHPFGNLVCVVEASGQEILDALELSVSKLPGEFGGFMHVSGLRFDVNLTKDSTVVTDDKGEFIEITGDRRVQNVTVLNGATGEYEPLDPEKTYSLASHNYMLKNGGDGFNMFRDNPLLQDEVMLDNQVLITYIVEKLNGTVGAAYADPYGEGRISLLVGDPLAPEAEAADTETEVVEPEATEPEATEPEPTEPEATEPEPTEPEATEPEATEPEATEPVETEAETLLPVYGHWHCTNCDHVFWGTPRVQDNQFVCTICGGIGTLTDADAVAAPEPAEPEANEPEVTEPEVTEPEATEPEVTEPEATEPEAEPETTEPEATEPEAEPEATEPEATEPEADSEATEPEAAADWTLSEEAGAALPEAVQAAFDKATEGLVGVTFTPVALLGQQVVAGTNYAVLCRALPAQPDAAAQLEVLVLYADLEGNAEITGIADFSLAAYEALLNAEPAEETEAEPLLGGWAAPEAYGEAVLPEAVKAALDAALEGFVGNNLTPVALLGEKAAEGVATYAILCHSSLVTLEPVASMQLLFLRVDADGAALCGLVTVDPAAAIAK